MRAAAYMDRKSNITHQTIRLVAVIAILFSGVFLLPGGVSAATATQPLEVSGWIPYWRAATGTADFLNHIDTFKEINPFIYTMKADGTIYDAAGVTEGPWPALIAAAKAKKVRVIPTIMWGNGDAIHAVLSNTKSRIALEDAITALVKQNNFDGIDIDFEGKKAETKTYFATFLKGLYQRMGNKWVMCTIEARTPLDSRYTGTPPADATMYANDYVAINKYCDRVRIMAYDQGTIDVKLNADESGPYVPVADPRWVEKVMNVAAQTISKKKLMIGIPTYGYEYETVPLSEGKYVYNMMWAFNPKYATDLAAQQGIVPSRNSAGEMSFLYDTKSLVPGTVNQNNIDTTTPTVVSTEGSTQTTTTNPGYTSYHILWWSDASAINDKVQLAKKLGLRGVSIFKIDGGEDPNMWNVLPLQR